MALPRRKITSPLLGYAHGPGFAQGNAKAFGFLFRGLLLAFQIDGKRAKPEPGAQRKRAFQLDGEAEPSPHIGRRSRSYIAPIQILILLFAASVSAQTPTNNTAQIRIELTAVHSDWNAAVESGDVSRAHSFYDPNFMMRLPGGKFLTLSDIKHLARLTKIPEVIERKHTTEIQRLTLAGEDAILTVVHTDSETHKLSDGSVRRLFRVIRQQERWSKYKNDWKLSIVENIEPKKSEVTLNGRKVDGFVPELAVAVDPNADDLPVLNSGFGLIFIYRLNDGAIIKAPIYCNEAKVARMTGGSFIKIKLLPGKYALRSDKGVPVDVVVEAGKIFFLSLKLEAGFPKGRGSLRVDTSIIGAEGYKLPRLLDLTPLGPDNIDDNAKVVIDKS